MLGSLISFFVLHDVNKTALQLEPLSAHTIAGGR
jgi:hypothetical protein